MRDGSKGGIPKREQCLALIEFGDETMCYIVTPPIGCVSSIMAISLFLTPSVRPGNLFKISFSSLVVVLW